MAEPDIIFMPLLDEGVDVWRPVSALRMGGGLFRVLENRPDEEKWPFSTGTVVRTEHRTFSDGTQKLVVIAKSDLA